MTPAVDQRPAPPAGATFPYPAGEGHGVGVVGLRLPGSGTLRIRAHPDSAMEVIAELRRPHHGPYELVADGLEPVRIEYGYEVAGTPFDSVAGRWARVAYGRGSAGAQARGWVDLEDSMAEPEARGTVSTGLRLRSYPFPAECGQRATARD